MTPLDKLVHGLRWRMFRSEAGIRIWRVARWIVPRVAPYVPPRSDLSPERCAARVPTEVRPSTITSAGDGLFAMAPIASGVTLGEYSGDAVVSVSRWLRLRNTDYVCQTEDPGVFVDSARRPECVLRYINHHPDPARRNARYHLRGRRVFMETTRAVEAGEELLADYGDLYWKLRNIPPNR